MKGIILAGGRGTRLKPITNYLNKHLIPLFNKPVIFYPLCTLMLSGIQDIGIVINPNEREFFEKLLGDGSDWNIKISLIEQEKPGGIIDAISYCENFLNGENFITILGDNIFLSSRLKDDLQNAKNNFKGGCTLFSYHVKDPRGYGVLKKNESVYEIIEKPKKFISNLVITGIYIYEFNSIEKIKNITFSHRGEREVTDLNNIYLREGNAEIKYFSRGYAWFDVGSFDSFNEASNLIKIVESRQNIGFGYPEEVAYNLKYISKKKLENLILKVENSEYSEYLTRIL